MNTLKLICNALLALFLLQSCKKESLFLEKGKPELVIGAGDERLGAASIHFVKDTVYVLAVNIDRNANQELVIDAGTWIKINNGISININAGGRIAANGTSSDPIVFTSSADKGSAGFALGEVMAWNGISITGSASVVSSLRYARIEFGGIYRSALSLINLSKDNTIDHVQVSYSQNSASFDLSGGGVNAHSLVSYASAGTDFRIRNGYRGMLQYLLAYRHPYFAANGMSGMSIDGTSTFPYVSNLTVLGPDTQPGNLVYGGSRVAGLLVTNSAKMKIRNSVILAFPKNGFYLDSRATGQSLIDRESEFSYSIVHCNDSTRAFYLPATVYPGYNSEDFKGFLLQPEFSNRSFATSTEFMLNDPFNYNIKPDPLPETGSPLLSGANFEGSSFSDPFFQPVSYVGAVGADNWLTDWANFLPLQTDYNN